jgi:copper chaperone
MACDGCETNVEDTVNEVQGVKRADADHEAGQVVVEGDASIDALVAAIVDAGYEVSA